MATPYSKYPTGIMAAFADACVAAGALLTRGELVYSPIAHTHPIAVNANIDPLNHAIWLPFDAAMIARCDGCIVVMMPGWRESFGIAHELSEFAKANKPVRYLSWPALEEVRP